MSSYSPNIGLIEPTPFDPAVANIWGTLLNTNFSLTDSAIAGLLSLNVAGNTNVVLTDTNGAADQARNKIFSFSGVLTGNIYVLWPNGKTGIFAVYNGTSGAFTLSVAVNNGSSAPAGTTVSVPQGTRGIYYTDGTNFINAIDAGSIITLPLVVASGGTGATTATGARTNLGLGTAAVENLANTSNAAIIDDGAGNLQLVNGRPVLHSQTFTASGTFTVPSTATSSTVFKFTFCGGGGGGGGGGSGGSSFLAPGGGSGGSGYALFTGFAASGSVTITCGAGGTGSLGATGNSGASTTAAYSASSFITATGGTGGPGGSSAFQVGGAPGSFSTNAGGSSLTLIDSGALLCQRGGTSIQGSISGSSGAGGASFFADGGIPKIGYGTTLAGGAGSKGSGGSGGTGGSNTVGGTGGDGVVVVEWAL